MSKMVDVKIKCDHCGYTADLKNDVLVGWTDAFVVVNKKGKTKQFNFCNECTKSLLNIDAEEENDNDQNDN